MVQPNESSGERLLAYGGVQKLPFPKAEMFQRRGFVEPELCAQLLALIEAERRPSTLADANGDHYFRTSETCDLNADHPAVQAMEAKLDALTGIDPAYGEPLQGQRYDVGQEFKAHTDYFAPDGEDWEKYCSVAGQRTWTCMVYLNDVEAGGATRFKVLKKSFQPEAGKLLAWNNRRPDGEVNPNTLHHGMKVRKGLKYVLTKWYREKPWGWE
ncbi:prolyl hydroxylase family protein [Qipengyuania sp. DSG2-2]|uniref:prolyl hydroxylase family protein n=1 Tax=Qipengyuania sp. DGS2-2 TaxID=3349631 RepID=UPI0036D26579